MKKKDSMAICPPIFFRDENGNIINPVKGLNDHVPYSPEKTCGRCHDYKKITEGYHFTQGKGEKITLARKNNTAPWQLGSITSFTFARMCGVCHPGGGPKAALVQDASVFNTSPRIWPPAKRIWSFYGPDIKPWNYYGEAHGYPEGLQPIFTFRPTVGWYKAKIYPLNRVYTRWVGIKTDGKSGIDQPHMKDIFMMWKKHMDNPDKNFPELKKIKDDNQDGFLEVNRPEEVKALLSSVKTRLKSIGFPLSGKTLVFVDGDRYTTDAINCTSIPKKPYEYSPYGSVFKFDHDICPAKNALGAKGCSDCHSSNSNFLFKKIMIRPFDEDGKPVTETNAHFLGYSSAALGLMAFEQGTLKSLGYWILFIVIVLLMLHYVTYGPKRVEQGEGIETVSRFRTWER